MVPRTADHMLRGRAYVVALHRHERQLQAIARATDRMLVLYQPVPQRSFHDLSFGERIVDRAYQTFERCIPARHIEEGRALVWHETQLAQRYENTMNQAC